MTVKIVIIGNDNNSSHIIFSRIPVALKEAALHLTIPIEITWVSTQDVAESESLLKASHGIFAAPSPYVDLEGFYKSVSFARVSKKPWLAACGGIQYALVEFGRNVLKLDGAEHVEADPECHLKFVNFLPDNYRVSNDGPLKTYDMKVKPDTLSASLYKERNKSEAFFANYMVDSKYLDAVESAGLKVAATFDDNKTPCLFELENHPFFLGALFLPQIVSTQKSPHPLIKRFLKIANSQF